MQHEHYIRIIKKEKDGVTLAGIKKIGLDNVKASWEDFNGMYEIREDYPYRAYLKSEIKEKHDKVNKLYDTAIVLAMSVNGLSAKNEQLTEKELIHGIAASSTISTLIKDAAELLGITMEDSIKAFKLRLNNTLGGMLNLGIGIKGNMEQLLDEKQEKQNEKNLNKIEEERKEQKTKETKKSSDSGETYRPFEEFFKKKR